MPALRRPFPLVALALVCAGAACTGALQHGDGGATGGSGGHGGAVVLGGAGSPSIPPNCGGVHAPVARSSPTFLLVVDRSESMRRDAAGSDCGGDCGPTSKWSAVTGAIGDVLGASPGNVGWGLLSYPSVGQASCDRSVGSELDVPLGAASGPAIVAALARQSPGGARPTGLALSAAAAYLDGSVDPKPAYLVLITDGVPACAEGGGATDDDIPATVHRIASARGFGVSTVVVGVGTKSDLAADSALAMLARAGGIQSAPASGADRAGLAARLEAIVRTVTSCAFALPPTSDDGTTSRLSIDVIVGGRYLIPRDPMRVDGWDYIDPNYEYIQLFGPLCETAQTGALDEVTVRFRCTGA